jgi:hypothetical protein
MISDELATHGAPSYFHMRHCFLSLTPLYFALSIRLDLDYLKLLKVGIFGTLETRSRRRKVMSIIFYLICKDECALINENT